jgi:hypothetical protein
MTVGRKPMPWLCLAALLAACSGSSAGGGGGGGDGGVTRRGSEACQVWQYAACDYLVTKCKSKELTWETCTLHYQSFACLSDEQATGCAEAYGSADCGSPPEECDRASIVDPKPAVSGCNQQLDAYCTHLIECMSTSAETIEECREIYAPKFSCDNAVGLYPWFEECLDLLGTLACDEEPAGDCLQTYLVTF